MRSRRSRPLALFALAAGLVAATGEFRTRADDKKSEKPAATDAPKFAPEQVAFYEKEVLPLLRQHCFKCHGDDPDKLKGELNLTTRKGLLDGGASGAAVDLKNPADSLLLKLVHYKDETRKMPPKSKLPDQDLATLEKWVA